MIRTPGPVQYVISVLFLSLLVASAGAAEIDGHGLMRPSPGQLEAWNDAYNQAPPVSLDQARVRAAGSSTGSKDLLPYLDYVPDERDQGRVGNCWAWAGTGVMEIAHAVQEGVRDRLSIEYLDANFHPTSPGVRWAGDGGMLRDFTSFYAQTGIAVPWSNPNADYRDGVAWCAENGRSLTPAYAIATDPHYSVQSITEERIPTRHLGQAQAIANIKSVLDGGRAVWIAFYLPNTTAWYSFYDHWDLVSENGPAWDPDPWVNTAWNEREGAGHAVVCVGYNDTDPDNRYWVLLNSWGTMPDRPNGLFHLSMDLDYDATVHTFEEDYASMLWMTERVEFGPAPVATPRVIDALPCVITTPGEYYLTRDFPSGDASRAIEVRASDVVLDGRNHTVAAAGPSGQYGLLAYRPEVGLENVTVRNLALSGWDEGAAFYNVTGGRLERSSVAGSTFAGVSLDGGTSGVSVVDCRLHDDWVGIIIRDSNRNEVTGCTVESAWGTGVSLYSAGENRVTDNRFSTPRNVRVAGTPLANQWNTTRTSRTNVVGGPFSGGNYWGAPDHRGWSDGAFDTDRDGIGDEAYNLSTDGLNVDALPLVVYAMPAPVAVPPGTGRPKDLDGDRLFEDVNGNGRLDFADVVVFFNAMEWMSGNEPVQFFDFNHNLRIDFGDVVELFEMLG